MIKEVSLKQRPYHETNDTLPYFDYDDDDDDGDDDDDDGDDDVFNNSTGVFCFDRFFIDSYLFSINFNQCIWFW